jgi:hypothetical protein
MTDRALQAALICAVITICVGLAASWMRGPALPGAPEGPIVGRAASEVAAGPAAPFRDIRARSSEEIARDRAAAADEAMEARLGASPPAFARWIVLYPLYGAPFAIELEEGAPWHILVDQEGNAASTERYRSGRQGVPQAIPSSAGRDALFVMIPHAGKLPRRRREGLGGLCAYLMRRLGLEGERLVEASALPGSSVDPFPGFSDLVSEMRSAER